ncbi:hypothetical protein [Mycobacterium sp. E1747]|uniref:hypothetical protein n=1 Tax=Mycobacterium sp. E1747 TaxID=1834128 RepID=UPI000ABFB5E0
MTSPAVITSRSREFRCSASAATGEPSSAGSPVATSSGSSVSSAPPSPAAAALAEQRNSRLRLVITAGLVICVALAALVGWLGFRAYQSHQAQEQRALFLQVGRQGALNLTTIDWQRADTDVQRILDSATGKFYDDMSKRQEPFVGVVKKAQSKSVGTITEAGLESESGDDAQVLVAVSVQTSNLGATDQRPRAWRMRISVHKTGDEVKVSNVEFVP